MDNLHSYESRGSAEVRKANPRQTQSMKKKLPKAWRKRIKHLKSLGKNHPKDLLYIVYGI
jgi:hypothetical protein